MNHVVVDLDEFDAYVRSLIDDRKLSKWLAKVLKKEVVIRCDWLTPSSVETSDDEHVKRAIENGEDLFEVTFSNGMIDEVRHIIDWLVELEQRDARLFAKLDRITWKQAVEHSKRWHEALARAAEKVKDETIPFDDDCPVMFTHDDGLKWVWLKTDKARDDEGRIMGHCVGRGGYDNLTGKSGVFSLRDSSGRPHVTVEFDDIEIVQAKMKGNVDVTDKYSKHVDEFYQLMEPLLAVTPKKEGVDHIVWWNGDEIWYSNGKKNRGDGPAVIKENGTQEWWADGIIHRWNGPAIIHADGDQEWWIDGMRHREDGPAVIRKNGGEAWYLNGVLHREDGPAIERIDGAKEWWKKGNLHREDGPAMQKPGQYEVWLINGVRHRDDGPAIIREDGDEEWWRHGKQHREDGPALTKADGTKEWWVDGVRHREDGPAVEHSNGDREWWVKGRQHRLDGPAIECANGSKEWWVNGVRHREDGPAISSCLGVEWWYLNGRQYSEEKYREKLAQLSSLMEFPS